MGQPLNYLCQNDLEKCPVENLMSIFSVSGDGKVQAFSLENIAAVVQINACQDCEEVEQQNLAFIFQDISSNNVFMYTPTLTTPDETFLNKIAIDVQVRFWKARQPV